MVLNENGEEEKGFGRVWRFSTVRESNTRLSKYQRYLLVCYPLGNFLLRASRTFKSLAVTGTFSVEISVSFAGRVKVSC